MSYFLRDKSWRFSSLSSLAGFAVKRGILFASVPSMVSDRPIGRVPRFKVGDEVIVVGLGSYKGKEGVVVHVTAHSGDFVHRYEVRLSDGTVTRFFGFELDFIISASA